MSCCRSNKPPSDDHGDHGSSGTNAVNTCKECIDFLIDYLDGTLPPAKKAEFELHLELCPPCHRYLTQYQATIRMGQAAMEAQVAKDPPPEALIKAIMAAMHKGPSASGASARSGSQHASKPPSKPKGDCGCDCDC